MNSISKFRSVLSDVARQANMLDEMNFWDPLAAESFIAHMTADMLQHKLVTFNTDDRTFSITFLSHCKIKRRSKGFSVILLDGIEYAWKDDEWIPS